MVAVLSDIKKLINLILSDEKLMGSKSMKNKVYTDEPIIKVASKLSNYVPPEITRLVREIRNMGFFSSSEAEFFRQAQLMKHFEDNCEYDGEFSSYFPTYRDMSIAQLRGYFTWRARVRKGIIEKTSVSYAFVYIYELLHLVGVSSPEKGYEALCDFHRVYGELDPRINGYMKVWERDFVVYYNLDRALLDTASDDALAVITDSSNFSDEQLFSAILTLSSYKTASSKLFKKHPDDFRTVTCRVYKALSAYYEKNRKNTLAESLFGQKLSAPYKMFQTAVFYDYRGYDDYEYVVSDVQKYTCKNGRWSCEKYSVNTEKSRKLGDIVKTIDSVMREKYSFGNSISRPLDTAYLLKIIEKEIDLLLEEKERNAAPKIEIDVSKLQGIRTAAAITRDKLIVEEECDTEESAEAEENTAENAVEEIENNSPLDDAEYEVMQCLLYGGDCVQTARKHGRMLSVLADSINEKLFDMFGDTVIEFDGDNPVLIEDYTDDLKGIVGQ